MPRGGCCKCKALKRNFSGLLVAPSDVDMLFNTAMENPPALLELVGSHRHPDTVVRTCGELCNN